VAKFIALLRAVNVGGRKVPMADLRALCASLGWEKVETYIQSGNIVFAAAGEARELEEALEAAIRKRFDLDVPTIVRSAAEWRKIVAGNPFAAEAEATPNWVLLGLAKHKIGAGAGAAIVARATAGERVEAVGEALWFHYPEGVGTSKLTPALIDRAAGSPVTGRNWRTVLALEEMATA
jgi:uncharacterized protein (DUF1697 family)